jgi:hypothetical protein
MAQFSKLHTAALVFTQRKFTYYPQSPENLRSTSRCCSPKDVLRSHSLMEQ